MGNNNDEKNRVTEENLDCGQTEEETNDCNKCSEEDENSKSSNDEKNEESEKDSLDKEEQEDNELMKFKSTKKENEKLKEDLAALNDKHLRTLAEYDNFRKRTLREKESIYLNAYEDVLKEFLPVLDNLERAVVVEGNVEDLKKGVEMTLKQFNTALEKLGVEEINCEGEFDPNLHNAVMHVDDETFEKNQVVEVFQKGYKKGDKVLRYSMVKVAN